MFVVWLVFVVVCLSLLCGCFLLSACAVFVVWLCCCQSRVWFYADHSSLWRMGFCFKDCRSARLETATVCET